MLAPVGVLAQHLRRVALRVERDEERLHFTARFPQGPDGLRDLGQVRRAHVGTVGIAEDDHDDLAAKVGERARLALALIAWLQPNVLLLDEPTNHLDLDTTTWLQDWLKDADETVIVVSHDRAFMDAICTNILHVEAKTSEAYKGNYSQFVPQRAERRLTREREMEKQRAYVKKEEEYIRRNIAGVNSFQAKGKRKRLERLPSAGIAGPRPEPWGGPHPVLARPVGRQRRLQPPEPPGQQGQRDGEQQPERHAPLGREWPRYHADLGHRRRRPQRLPELLQRLVDVQADVWWAWDVDGSVWLLPAYRFIGDDGHWRPSCRTNRPT